MSHSLPSGTSGRLPITIHRGLSGPLSLLRSIPCSSTPWQKARPRSWRYTTGSAALIAALTDDSTVVHLRSEEGELLWVDAGLSPPQREVLRLIAAGLSEAEAAGRTGRSVHTVHNHLRAIYKVFGVHSRRELFARLGQGLTAGPDATQDSPLPEE